MKWFEHSSIASANKKIKPVLQKYGAAGYGLYFFCVELVARELTPQNTSCRISWDSETIAADLHLTTEKVKEMLAFMAEKGLFEADKDGYTCKKIMCRLDGTMSQNPTIKRILNNFKGLKDA